MLRWRQQFGRHGLPWQGTRDPYRVWLSEIMLQQTQVATVLDYYARFLQRFPDAGRAGRCAAGRRAGAVERPGLLQPRAQPAPLRAGGAREHGGVFPRSSQALAQLPGIGRSTAAAIAAFCFGERVAILDGNVKRVLGRALGFDADLSRSANEQELWRQAQALLPAQRRRALHAGPDGPGRHAVHRAQARVRALPAGRRCASPTARAGPRPTR